ncbi:hypothetical protein KGP84_22770 [Burkholderia multivorans]|uniref:hypothetical protein n=1 Tax=Burkholderia multivorans TaxID=87883 RepID=UPI0020A11EA7|nr:hypothetical protein [Burkholderia multivorans]MCO8552973.1 hypothetical protein [Burkholderia multivorans]
MNLIQIIDEIQASHQYVNNIIEYDDKYDLVEYKGKLIVIEKEQVGKSTPTASFFYISNLNDPQKLSIEDHPEGAAKRFVEYYNQKKELKAKMLDDLEKWSRTWIKTKEAK